MTDPVPVPEAAVEAAKKAYAEAESAPNLVHCERCKGTGYHHGFGEDGHDPDWCRDCGGGGFALAAGEEDRPLRSALAAALPHLGWRDIETDPPPHDVPVLLWSPPTLGHPDGLIEARPFSTGRRGAGWSEYSQHSWATKWMPLPPPPSSKEDRT